MVADLTSLATSAGFPLMGGGAVGFAFGYALKKIMKLAFIGLGLLALLLGYLSYQKWILVNHSGKPEFYNDGTGKIE